MALNLLQILLKNQKDLSLISEGSTFCPGCGVSYAKGEIRMAFRSCPVCNGMQVRAEEARSQIRDVLRSVHCLKKSQIRHIINTIGAGYIRAEIQAYLSEIEEAERRQL